MSSHTLHTPPHIGIFIFLHPIPWGLSLWQGQVFLCLPSISPLLSNLGYIYIAVAAVAGFGRNCVDSIEAHSGRSAPFGKWCLWSIKVLSRRLTSLFTSLVVGPNIVQHYYCYCNIVHCTSLLHYFYNNIVHCTALLHYYYNARIVGNMCCTKLS